MKATLIIFKLKVTSSYNQNIERPAEKKSFDTLQFFVQDTTIYRIKTFAMDHDVHIHLVNLRDRTVAQTIDFLITSTHTHYGDVIDKAVFLEIKDRNDQKGIQSLLKKEGLTPYISIRPDFIFWSPDNKEYKTQSNPL